MDRLAYKIECVSALAGAGSQYSPDAFTPNPALFATSTLGNIAVYDNKANRLFSEIIGWFNARRCDELEISFAVFTETIGKILSLATFWNIVQRNIKKRFSACFHSFCKADFCKLFGLVKNTKHITHCTQQSLAVIGGGFIRKTGQIFNVPDKMSDAKLYQNIKVFHIFAIGREIITANNTSKVFAKNINQYSRATCIGNLEQGVSISSKAPSPETLFAFLMTSFVNIKLRFMGQIFKKFLIDLLKSSRCFLYQFAQLATRDGYADNITQKLANRRKRTMTGTFHISNNRSKMRSDQLAFLNVGWHRSVMKLLTMFAPVAKSIVLFNVNWLFNDFNLLNNFSRALNLFKFTAAIRADIKSMCLKCIDFFGRKGRSFVLGMSGLAAPIAGCVGFFLSRRFDNIRRWRF